MANNKKPGSLRVPGDGKLREIGSILWSFGSLMLPIQRPTRTGTHCHWSNSDQIALGS